MGWVLVAGYWWLRLQCAPVAGVVCKGMCWYMCCLKVYTPTSVCVLYLFGVF